MLGYGYPVSSLERGLSRGVDFIGADNGSTDPGPYYLGSGKGFVKNAQIRRDLEPALCAAVKHKIPLIIGSAGGSGAKPHLENFLSVLEDLSKERGLHFKLAYIEADISKETVLRALREGKISSCGNSPALTEDAVRASGHIVGQMGTGPFIEALESGADVIIAGRACDTAIFAAYPIMKGFPAPLALHCAKIAECGTMCSLQGGANDVLFAEIERDSFTVEPENPEKICVPESVMCHSLYEQPDPDCFYEPEGKIDLSNSVFEQITERAVRVSGTRLDPAAKETVKLEGARLCGYRAATIAGIRDPLIIKNIDAVEEKTRLALDKNFGRAGSNFSLRFLKYGMGAVSQARGGGSCSVPDETGLLIEVVAPSQEEASTILSFVRSTALHQSFPGRKSTAGNLAFPFSPSDFNCGEVYEFSVYHLMETEGAGPLFKIIQREI
jgi:hypothetical protein